MRANPHPWPWDCIDNANPATGLAPGGATWRPLTPAERAAYAARAAAEVAVAHANRIANDKGQS